MIVKEDQIFVFISVDDWDNWYIELFENFPCNSKEELNKREGEIIREIGTVNKQIAGRTYKEYYEDNKDEMLKKMKEYRQNNKGKKKEYDEEIRFANIKKNINKK